MLGGSGTLRFEGGNRLILSADTTLNFGLVDFLGSSSLVSSNTLTIASGAIVRFDHNSTINGPVVVNGTLTLNNVSATLRINAALTLNASGTISNSGVIGAFAFVNNGGTISGNAPTIISPALSQLRIDQFIFTNSAPISALDTGKLRASDRMVILKWAGAAGEQFSIESTADLRAWTNLPAAITESVPGAFQATMPAESVGARFYRLRRR